MSQRKFNSDPRLSNRRLHGIVVLKHQMKVSCQFLRPGSLRRTGNPVMSPEVEQSPKKAIRNLVKAKEQEEEWKVKSSGSSIQ